MIRVGSFLFFVMAVIEVAPGVFADETFFRERIAPVLERRCVQCHREDERKGGLSLASATAAKMGGENGAAIEPGKSTASLLMDMVSGDKPEMPKNGPPLSAEEVAALRQWIDSGANWPDELTLRDRSLANADWWSLRPLAQTPVPKLSEEDARRVRTPIDAFVMAKLRELKLSPSPEADRRTLIRRVTFDLIGLPPTLDEIETFLRDADSRAYETLVDRLLNSPHYGERWARHWLDVVHYGDTHGYDKDQPRANAWPYRDYVIRAFNDDKPYSRFVHEQLAGDVLWPDSRDGLVATGFIAAGPWDLIGHAEVPETKLDGQVARHLDRDDMVTTTLNTFCSVTVQCAQCHNHKFDPVTQQHYYGLQAVFAALDRADREFEPDPKIAQERRRLREQHEHHVEEQKRLNEQVRKLAGPPLEVLDRQLAELDKQRTAKEENPAYGYHSQIMPTADHVKWVQVDLGQPTRIERLIVVGCWDAFNNIGPGFGFPARYMIEVSADPAFNDATAPFVATVLDRTAADEPNPGTKPQIAIVGQTARYVRITATKLAPRQNDFIFALSELQVFDARGVNVALGKEVSAADSIEAPVRWSRQNLVDGYFYGVKSDPSTQEAVTRLTGERERLITQVTPASLQEELVRAGEALRVAKQSLEKLPPPGLVYCGCVHRGSGSFAGTGANGGKPRDIRLLIRGSVQTPGELAEPGALPIIPNFDAKFALPANHGEADRRAALAQWITHRDHPLTWRSIVNRVWQYHFGRGLVDSPNDFGRMGQLPTHPELLDWLAVEFRDGRQSIKDLHRLIVLSATYRQVSAVTKGFEKGGFEKGSAQKRLLTPFQNLDTDNRFLWRMNRRKLEAEAVRDAVLAVAGKLDRTQFGPAFQDFVIEKPEHSPHYEYDKYDPNDPRTHRRSIYRFLVRSQPQPFMNTLDCADPSQLVDKRNETLTALQALALLNNKFMLQMSAHFAARVAGHTADPPAQIDFAFRLAIGRGPSVDERDALVAYASQFGLPNTCRVLFNLNEFAFVD